MASEDWKEAVAEMVRNDERVHHQWVRLGEEVIRVRFPTSSDTVAGASSRTEKEPPKRPAHAAIVMAQLATWPLQIADRLARFGKSCPASRLSLSSYQLVCALSIRSIHSVHSIRPVPL